jgi:hypothetical protein
MREKRYTKLLQTWVTKQMDDKIVPVAEQIGVDKADAVRLVLRDGLPRLLDKLPAEVERA